VPLTAPYKLSNLHYIALSIIFILPVKYNSRNKCSHMMSNY